MTNLDRFKLRAWHREEKRMFEVAKIDFDRKIVWESRQTRRGGTVGWDIEEVDLLQCTGLKDKNGKLIFEGDIVKVHHTNKVIDIAEVRYVPEDLTYEAFGKVCTPFVNTRWNNSFEIIGNKYENPELLKNTIAND